MRRYYYGDPALPHHATKRDMLRNLLLLCNCETGKFIFTLAVMAAVIGGTYALSKAAAVRYNSDPNELWVGYVHNACTDHGIFGCYAHADIHAAAAKCSEIFYHLLNPAFLSAARIPIGDYENRKYMDVLKFVCGFESNITLGNSTFFHAGCADAPSSGDRSNTGELSALFGKFSELYNLTSLTLICKNGDGYADYTTGAIAVGCLIPLVACCICCVVFSESFFNMWQTVANNWTRILPRSGDFSAPVPIPIPVAVAVEVPAPASPACRV